MSNPLKYSTTTPTGALRHDTLGAGVASIQYDQNWNSGVKYGYTGVDGTAYYLVYEPVEGTAVRVYAPINSSQLIRLAQSKGSSETTESGALTWLSANGYYPVNRVLDNIVTDDLVLYLDSRTATSYPLSGTTWLDLSGTGADWTIPSDVFNSSTGVMNYASDQSSLTPPAALQSTTDLTVEVLYKPNTGGIYTGCCDTIFGRYDFRFFQIGASLYAMIGFDDGNGTRVYQHPAYTVSYDRWHHVLAIRRDNRYIIWIDGVEKYNTTYGTGLSLWDPSETYYLSTTRQTNVDYSSCRIYTKGLSDSEILQNYYQGPIVTDDLVFALDASNLSSFEPGTTAAYSLTGSSGAAAGDGVLTNGVGFSNVANGTWDFDGVDDTILSSYTLPSGDKTLEFWVNYNTLASSGGGGYSLMGVQQVNAYLYTGIQSNGSGYSYAGNTGGAYSYTFSASTWYHIATVMDNGTTRHYVNGIQVATKAYTVANASTIGVSIGAINSQHEMDALIPITRIYNRALTAAEVEQNYNANIKKFT
jgi:hypothetical protein